MNKIPISAINIIIEVFPLETSGNGSPVGGILPVTTSAFIIVCMPKIIVIPTAKIKPNKFFDFDAIFTNVDSGYADIGMAGITITEERESLYDFTVPYYQASQKLIVSKDNIDFDECNTAKDVESRRQNRRIDIRFSMSAPDATDIKIVKFVKERMKKND